MIPACRKLAFGQSQKVIFRELAMLGKSSSGDLAILGKSSSGIGFIL
jgi:hypothetical protein